MEFTDNEHKELLKLSDKYLEVKSLILYSEEIDPESKSNLQIIKELRDAFDHIMLVVRNKGNEGEEGYNVKNIDKALGHVYRAAFDALDGAVLSLKEEIYNICNEYEPEILKEVITDYWDMKIEIIRISENVGILRESKDATGDLSEIFSKYVIELDKLKEYHESLLLKGEALDECKKNNTKKNRKANLMQLFWLVLAIILTAIVTYVMAHKEDTIETNTSTEETIIDIGVPNVGNGSDSL